VSIIEVYNPSFGDFHGVPTITWQEKRGGIRTEPNMLAQYNAWMNSKLPKDEPHAAFWESNGPAIVRALRYCGAAGLVFDYATDRKVVYRWFGRMTEVGPFGPKTKLDYFYICSVTAEGGCQRGNDTRVIVTMPTDEDFTFVFHPTEMLKWFKPKQEEEKPTS
jgi:hypothetical protein